jgi:hypothetical protein
MSAGLYACTSAPGISWMRFRYAMFEVEDMKLHCAEVVCFASAAHAPAVPWKFEPAERQIARYRPTPFV